MLLITSTDHAINVTGLNQVAVNNHTEVADACG